MKVTWLVALLPLHIWICTCMTGTNADSKSHEEELIWKKMRSSLQYVHAAERPVFLMRCGGGYTCTTNDVSNSSWLAGTGTVALDRFWHTYACFKDRDIKTCPVDGSWGAWSPWSKCTAKCGEEANSTRTRPCNNPLPVNGGLACSGYGTRSSVCRGKCDPNRKMVAALVESEAFLTKIHKAYPKLRPLCLRAHCLYSRVASVVHGGDAERYWSSLQCFKYKRACPVDGGWSSWTKWTHCEPKCGTGMHWRHRKCTNPPPANNGFICRGPFYEEKPCVGKTCFKSDFLIDVYLSEWTVFGPCSVSCGKYGVKEKRRVCLSRGKCGDFLKRHSDTIAIRKPCFRGPCTPYGTWSDWSQFTDCSADCGKGRQIRIRTCDGLHSSGSRVCTGQSINVTSCEKRCEKDPVPMNGTAASFVPVHKAPPKAWKPDPNNPYLYELEADRIRQFTQWSAWSKCSKSCETGQRSRSRNCTVAGRCFGEVKQVLFCNTDKCPVNGGWSEWLAWAHCSTTCGPGQRNRYRKCDKPLPQFGGTCFGNSEETSKCNLGDCKGIQMDYAHWTTWTSCSTKCGFGLRSRSRKCILQMNYIMDRKYRPIMQKRGQICKNRGHNIFMGTCGQMPCPVAGDWAHWGSWSACSHSCGGGVHFRDRTCTDPAPLYGGRHCKGQGSEVTPCFHGPCPDREDTGVRLNGSSGLLYPPFNRPQSYLSLHLVVNPLRPHGTLVSRSRICKLEKCRHSVNMSLVNGKPHLEVVNSGSKITIKSNTTLQVREWHTIYVYLSQFHGFLRVNNGAHLRAKYHPKPSAQVNYDSGMTLGATTDDGFVGVIAEAKVNYQVLSLRRIAGWSGYGMPEDEWSTQIVRVDPVTKYPKFKGDTFMKLSISDLKTLHVQMSIWPQKLEGLVLFNKGRVPGSYVYLIIYRGVFRFCFNCGQLHMCANVQDVEAKRWYHVSIEVSGIMSSIRINLGKAVQLTSPGLPYHTGSHVFVGGGESNDWVVFHFIMLTNRGFSGAFNEITINGQFYGLRTRPLVDSRGFMNTEGVSSSEKVLEVLEQNDSNVVLRCDFSRYAHSGSDVYVEWFHVDRKIKSAPNQKITPRLPGNSYLGALTLSGKGHGSGLYVCMIQHDGRLTNHMAFVLIRDNTHFVFSAADMEVTGVEGFLVFMAIFALFVLVCATCKVFQQAKEDGIRPMLQKLKQFKARALRKDKADREFSQPPGIDDLCQAELVPKENAEETDGDPSDDAKDPQDEISETSGETRDIEIDLHSSYNGEDDDNEGQQPVIQSLQSIQNRPSMHGTSGAALHEGARRSSVTLRGTQSARYDDEVPRRSSVTLRGTQSARYDDEVPRRSSVTLRGTQSYRDDMNDNEILSSDLVTIDDSQHVQPEHRHPSHVSAPPDVAKGVSSYRNSHGDVSRGISSHATSRIDAARGVSSNTVPKVRSSFSSRDRLASSQQAFVTESNDAHPPQPPITWTHRSTEEINKDPFRSGTSISPSRQLSYNLENQLSSSLPPAGSPSPPRSPLLRTSPSRQQPELAISVSANKSFTGRIDAQPALPTVPFTPTLPQRQSQNCMTIENVVAAGHNEEASPNRSSCSSDHSTDFETGTDSEASSSSFPSLPRPPSPIV